MARAIGLGVLFGVGMIFGVVLAPLIFLFSLVRGLRAFHPRGMICRANLVALDPDVGARLAGSARIRLSGSTGDENSAVQTVLGMAIKTDAGQDLPLATFESFLKLGSATKNTIIADYLANQYASVTPWHVRGLGIVWLRAVPSAPASGTGSRVERLDAAIKSGQATFVLEARDAAGATAAVRIKVAEIHITERLADDDPSFTISMFHTAAGFVPTGVRNGIRVIVYPTSQLARRLRGG